MAVDTLSLAGKVAIVTGSGRENGIGAAIAVALAKNGAAVTINYVSDASASRAAAVAKKVEAAGGRTAVIQAAVDTQEGAAVLVRETLKAFNTRRIDILVNNAGAAPAASTLDTTREMMEQAFRVNVFGPLFLMQAGLAHMPAGGRVVNISSVVAKLGLPSVPVYGASKAALDSLTYTWAQEFGRSHGITVNAIAPGPVDTDIAPTDPALNPSISHLLSLTRGGERVGAVEDIADAVLLVVSEKSRWVTGQVISVSGGITGQ